ncbi:acyl-CoA dehydrogenase family protein [Xenorhabdus bovienii]|uniref:Acyl-CoA dehydrogenase type 2 domain protein n=1 Tax=Xenorhabdus bovienii str. feltiae Moldova TaxID=1398200 RepID=A0A077NDL1_XENBV|nr:acyl-CoA dehydrogenase family protein [Xenorhabdus bovienii]CDH00277.1 Acyl-CoA dehydrogenase type 2 domain protein [Xenorhabdus bovienii str. feltiae Moldova]
MNTTLSTSEYLFETPDTVEKILSHAKKIIPILRENSELIENSRRLPQSIVDLLRNTGVFRAAMPKEWGGPELNSMQQTELIETIAIGDTSAAWCSMIGMDSGVYSGFLPPDIARELYPRLDMANSGWIHPQGRAERVNGGFKVSGNWRFGSGITHCDVLVAGVVVYQNGKPEIDPITGAPEHWRVIVSKPSKFNITDTWYTTGLAGSGSLDYSVSELFIPEEHSFSFAKPYRSGPLHCSPDAILRKMSGIPLGMARACLDYVRNMVPNRIDRETKIPWQEDVRVQSAIACAEMELSAVRAAVYSTLENQWQKLETGNELSIDDRVSTALARYNAFRTCRSIVQKMYDLVGGSSVYRKSPLDRWLRDVETMCQHAVAQDSILQLTGRVLVGGKSTSPFF